MQDSDAHPPRPRVYQESQKALVELLPSLFTVDELRRFVTLLPNGHQIGQALPVSAASPAALAFEVVAALGRHGQIDDGFFAGLVAKRPGRQDEIVAVQIQFQQATVPLAAPQSGPASPPRSPAATPSPDAPSPAPPVTPNPSTIGVDYATYLTDYAAWTNKTFEKLPMLGLGGASLEFKLDDIYVPLAFAPQESVDMGLGGDNDFDGETVPNRINIREAFALAGPGRHLFLRGEPGSGKTTVLKSLLWSLIAPRGDTGEPGFDGRVLGLPEDIVPVFLRLRSLAGPDLDRDFGDVLDDALVAMTKPRLASTGTTTPNRIAAADLPSAVPAGFGRWLWQHRRLLILLDGLDEIVSADARREVCRYVENLAKQGDIRGNRVVASSRFTGFQEESRINLDRRWFLHLDVRRLERDQIVALVQRWFVALGRLRARMRHETETGAAERALAEAQQLLAELEQDKTIKLREITSTPLLLMSLCLAVDRGGQIPKRQVDFFSKCLNTLLGAWPRERVREPLLSLDESLDLLEPVAWQMHTSKSKYDLGEDALRRLWAPLIRELQNQPGRTLTFSSVRDWLCRVTGVLNEYAAGEYGFRHLSLQEYLAATHAAHTGALDLLVKHFADQDRWWREVTLLFVALREHRYFGTLMQHVIDAGHLMREDSRKHIYECLVASHRPDLAPFLAVIRAPDRPARQRTEALRLVRDQRSEAVIAAASEVAVEPPPADADANDALRAVGELRKLAEQVEANAPPILDEHLLAENAVDVLILYHDDDQVVAQDLADTMTDWGWHAEVANAVCVEDEPWRRARVFVVLAGAAGPWQHAATRQGLAHMVRRDLKVVSVLADTENIVLPPFLDTRAQVEIGVDMKQDRLAAMVADMLGVDMPLLANERTPPVLLAMAGEGQGFVDATTQTRLLWVPGGTFWIGSGDEDQASRCDEKPTHRVQISPYWLAETPVTNQQYELFVKATGYAAPGYWSDRRFNQPQQPVVGVTWDDAVAFCTWLSAVSGRRIALPTEAQWEFAARGQDGRRYPWGNEHPDETRTHFDKAANAPLPVGSLPSGRGPFGHLDLVGNAWEWCQDAFDAGAYKQRSGEAQVIDPCVEPPVDVPRNAVVRVCRGGAFDLELIALLRAAQRFRFRAANRIQSLGFRVAALPCEG